MKRGIGPCKSAQHACDVDVRHRDKRAYIDTQATIAVCQVCWSALMRDRSDAGRGWSLGRLLSFSWDPAAKVQAGQQLDHNAPSRCLLFPFLLPFSLSCLPSGYGLRPFLCSLPFALCPLDLCAPLCPVLMPCVQVPCRLGTAGLSKTQSSSSSIEPVGEDKSPTTRALTFSEMAHQISSPFGFLRCNFPATANCTFLVPLTILLVCCPCV